MSSTSRITCAIWFLTFLGTLNVALADATLRAGDQIEMKLGGVPATDITSVSGVYTIDGSGAVNLPYVGRVKIVGLTPGVAQSMIERAFKAQEIYNQPNVVITMHAQSRFVNVGGEVKTPSRVPFTDDLTVLGSINAAGGFTPFADQGKVRLLRGNDVMIINVKKVRKNPSLDLQLQPGDRIEVPMSLF
jgi:protein involved in polysaccharide export with SLBB domain